MAKPTESYDEQRPTQRPIVPKIPYRKYGFFRDDQIIFLVWHAEDTVNNEQLVEFRKQINSFLKEKDQYSNMNVDLPDVITFPKLSPEYKIYQQPNEIETEIETERKALSLLKFSITDSKSDAIDYLYLSEDLNNRFTGSNILGLDVAGTTLDWITSVVSQGSGTGGPGGTPTPYYGSRKNAPYRFDLKDQLEGCGIYGDGTGVDVVILDTAPSAHDLVAAHKEWPDHPIIEKLLGPDGKLILYPTSYQETLRLGNLSLNDSDYKMTDHGLFIAGIIHSVVPEARIHLIEVLNQNGVGDLISFTTGLQRAIEQISTPSRKMVINCSWMLDFPTDDQHCHHPKDKNVPLSDPDRQFEEEVKKYIVRNKQKIADNLERLFNRSDRIGRGAVAAAGNDAYNEVNSNHIRPPARYPAALTRVLGVGALPTTLEKFGSGTHKGKYKTSDFSNRSDIPEMRGIATLGGEPGEGKGILGLYLGEFPDGRRNTSKWAWWAGTSFATPLLTAAVASVLSNTQQPAAGTQEAIDLIRHHLVDGSTDVDEEVIPITQCR